MKLTHLDKNNTPRMVDVSKKDISTRQASASGIISMNPQAFQAIKENSIKKGPVLQTAITAAIMGTKKTSQLIPMCHPLMISNVQTQITELNELCAFKLKVSVKCEGKTGVEMEALTGVSIGLLTIYDMVKAIDKTMTISQIVLESKKGGKSGTFMRTE
ncbi:cyclic pyranopterin monophosphate synthase MoaC [Campylobacter sp. MIT 21-1685]|uniref:cyclic pyranopterin monophosphate synthase MoaC n=1 Tax=unclassified Campylobacter TaxID=2593542 RepID=UPI00224AAD83|nr:MULTISPECIES: cyclic pyranopterin monophosphate synthase MoaC [unclassified Campylobacter]MCX2683065.1 cyclic pyranopterin monophosphate synthase MoaC [Campylobacter sp. MIT 21-1684]MCX2751347.1 cyclic pyranopterin monophosphate synthase MoaC [Campylobacter sp. MIT 21-1682]MCX2807546.1 cyclic pyranopterin monophosphate synthase MoaC [Campylobacter sp. MIT 21-1685]